MCVNFFLNQTLSKSACKKSGNFTKEWNLLIWCQLLTHHFLNKSNIEFCLCRLCYFRVGKLYLIIMQPLQHFLLLPFCRVGKLYLWGADQGKAHLNDVRFNSNWVYFTNNDCLKIDMQYQKFLKIPKFGLTEGVIFNSENCKLSWFQKW